MGILVLPTLIVAILAAGTSIARADAPAAQQRRAPQIGTGRVIGASAEPPRTATDGAPASCPFHFASDMPVATFCVYRGIALGGNGEVCASDVVALWGSLSSPEAESAERAASAAGREVYLAFVADPDLVVRAVADRRRGDRADLIGYTLGSEAAPQPLTGRMALRTPPGTADTLTVDLLEPHPFRPGGCVFASYSGTFLGMIRRPSTQATSIAPFEPPRP